MVILSAIMEGAAACGTVGTDLTQVIAISVAVDSNTGRAVTTPKVSGRGFSDDPKALDAVVPLVEMELSRLEVEGVTDTHRIAQAVRRVVGRWVADTYRRRPMIVPTVIPV